MGTEKNAHGVVSFVKLRMAHMGLKRRTWRSHLAKLSSFPAWGYTWISEVRSDAQCGSSLGSCSRFFLHGDTHGATRCEATRNGTLFVSRSRNINVEGSAVRLKSLILSRPIQTCRLRRMLQIKLVASRVFVAPNCFPSVLASWQRCAYA